MKLFVGPLKCLERIEYGEARPKPYHWYSAIGVSILFIILYSIASAIPQFPLSIAPLGGIGLDILCSILEIGLIIGCVNAISGIFLKRTYLEPIKNTTKRDYWYVFLITIAFMFLVNALIYPFYNFIPENQSTVDAWEILSRFPLYLFITSSIAAPLIEETFFRGVIFKGLLRTYSPKTAIIVSSVIFGVIHGNIHQFITASMLGMLIAFVYYKTDSIYLAMFIHFINNTLANFLVWGDSIISQLIISSIYLALSVGIFILIKKKYKFPVPQKRNFSEVAPKEYDIDLI